MTVMRGLGRRPGALPFVVIAVALAGSVGGCATAPSVDPTPQPVEIHLPTWDTSGPVPMAVASGILREDGGCLYLEEGDSRHLIVWPRGFAAFKVDGTTFVRDPGSARVISVNEPILLVGGEQPDRSTVEGLVGRAIPASCSGPFWLVARLGTPEDVN